MEKNINVIGILWIVYGAIGIFTGFFLFMILFGVSFLPDMGYTAPAILRAVGIGLGLFLTLLSIPEIFAGYGVLKGKEWGRILALVMSFLNVLSLPLGTALSIYTFVILIKEDSVRYFQKS